MVFNILLALYAFGMLSVLWMMLCNNKTIDQRRKMIDIVHQHNIGMIERRNYKSKHAYPDDFITYNKHMFSLFLLRDPRKLYEAKGWKLEYWA